MYAVSLFLLCSAFGLLKANVCPSKEDMRPCQCTFYYKNIWIECSNLLSAEQLNPPMRAIERSKTKVQRLNIKNSTLLYLPDELFRNTNIEKVYFRNTEIMSISEFDYAFNGLEEFLTVIGAVATQVKLASHWNFEQFRNLKKLRNIIHLDVHMGAIDCAIPHFPELIELYMVNTGIAYITDDAFSNLPKLTYVNFYENEIIEVKRSMFPNPANHLSFISLGHNLLSYLPKDFFDNMPSLTRIRLDKNKFATLSEKPFLAVFRNLKELLISDNPFRCDCRMNWLVNVRFPPLFDGKCSTPKSLTGRNISTLDYNSLWCLIL